eukprot:7337808-Prymnesium_polylepis.1
MQDMQKLRPTPPSATKSKSALNPGAAPRRCTGSPDLCPGLKELTPPTSTDHPRSCGALTTTCSTALLEGCESSAACPTGSALCGSLD